MEMESKPSSLEDPEMEVEENMSFDKSFQELRELRSQLHHAADYCEATFLKSKEKTQVVENTKEYICRAMVTVVDHLGNVSANLECLISETNAFSEAELRINSLRQRLLSCEQYAHKLALTNMRWNPNLPRFHSRYLSSPPSLERSSCEKLRESVGTVPSQIKDKHVMEAEEPNPVYTHKPFPAKNTKSATAEEPNLVYTHKPFPAKNTKSAIAEEPNPVYTHKPFPPKNTKSTTASVVPVRDGLSVLTKVSNPTFHFQYTQKVGRHRKSFHGSDILWLIRRTKRTH